MRVEWSFDDADLTRLRAFVARFQHHPFVQRRRARNVAHTEQTQRTREELWWAHLGCLLTSQQRSGAGSPVAQFLDQEPFSLALERCFAAPSAHDLILAHLRDAGGIRFSSKIADMASANLAWFDGTGWTTLEAKISALAPPTTRDAERAVARWVDRQFEGMGPKQARNFLQWVGLTRYEIPIDSRVTRWGNDFGFPFRLSATALADEAYYEFVLDGIQLLCATAGVVPCELDAMIVSQSEPDDWAGGRAG